MHDYFEGPIYLNRQVIALLESRHIQHSIFILFQNQHLLRLCEALLYLPSTFDLLNEQLHTNLFQLRDLILKAEIDLIHEPFFRQLITTICQHDIKRLEVNILFINKLAQRFTAFIYVSLGENKNQNFS